MSSDELVTAVLIPLHVPGWYDLPLDDNTDPTVSRCLTYGYRTGNGDHVWFLSLHNDGEYSLLGSRASLPFKLISATQAQLAVLWSIAVQPVEVS